MASKVILFYNQPPMIIGCLRIDFTFAHLSEIESVYIPKSNWPVFAKQVMEESPIFEMVILATCNRFEIYFTTQDTDTAFSWLYTTIASQKELPIEKIKTAMKTLSGRDAIQHLFQVSAGVESMVFGEDEILSQVKSSYADFQALGLTKSMLNKLFQTAIAAGKRARHETEISRGAYSVSSIAVDTIRELRLDYFGSKILIIGAGTIAIRALKKLHALGHPHVWLCNRTDEKVIPLVSQYGVQHLAFANRDTHIHTFDIILIATASTEYLLDIHTPIAENTLILDLCVPRNVDPDLGKKTQLLTIESLQAIATKNVSSRRKEYTKVSLILDEEMDKLSQWLLRKTL